MSSYDASRAKINHVKLILLHSVIFFYTNHFLWKAGPLGWSSRQPITGSAYMHPVWTEKHYFVDVFSIKKKISFTLYFCTLLFLSLKKKKTFMEVFQWAQDNAGEGNHAKFF